MALGTACVIGGSLFWLVNPGWLGPAIVAYGLLDLVLVRTRSHERLGIKRRAGTLIGNACVAWPIKASPSNRMEPVPTFQDAVAPSDVAGKLLRRGLPYIDGLHDRRAMLEQLRSVPSFGLTSPFRAALEFKSDMLNEACTTLEDWRDQMIRRDVGEAVLPTQRPTSRGLAMPRPLARQAPRLKAPACGWPRTIGRRDETYLTMFRTDPAAEAER